MIFPIPGGNKIGSHYLPRYTRYRVIAGRVIKGGHCTHTSPGNVVMMQLMSCLDEHLPRNGAIFFVTILRNALRKSLETHVVDNVKP